jgi:transcriptional regulator with XRE-family HTH domain
MKINNFDKQISSLRLESDMTRAELAEKLNVSVRLISYWENGKRECDFDMLIRIADIFGISVDYLLGRSDY